MSMPGFTFHFACESCDANSDAYSIFPFHDLFRPELALPTSSFSQHCWGELRLSVSCEQREHLIADFRHLLAFAQSLSSDALTIGVPKLGGGDLNVVTVTPRPHCPQCGGDVTTNFGSPDASEKITLDDLAPEEFDLTPISAIELSVRSQNICYSLGMKTIGQLRHRRDEFSQHQSSSPATMAEIDQWLKLNGDAESAR